MNFNNYINLKPYAQQRIDLRKHKEYCEEQVRLEEAFKKDLMEELNIVDNPKAELLYTKAYDIGHSLGYAEIYNVASNLVDLIR